MQKTIKYLSSTYSFGVALALILAKKKYFFKNISRYLCLLCSKMVIFIYLFIYLIIWLFVNVFVFFLLKVVSMEVVQDFINSPSLEKFKNISSSQRRSLLAEYFKVCNLAEIWYTVFDSLLDNCFVC